MKKKMILVLISVASLVAFLLIFMTMVFPFSFLSFNKSYTYEADAVIVEIHNTNLKQLKRNEIRFIKEGLTKERIQYILQTFEQEWLTSRDAVKFTNSDTESILNNVKETRNILLDIGLHPDFPAKGGEQLKDLINSLQVLEDEIDNLHNSKSSLSIKTLNLSFQNLHKSFTSTLTNFETFIETMDNLLEGDF
ncbi:hypothetical protein CIB95_04275 [Lottiidibacillus patelloidae]|uniref:Uncharacterized protein n=1 Tax=Lottiidibacillus patelloidae TaxID=2670334 RepID=A0A263BV17_9BACI|nr:hypothetical protein [Lottiidibacillus patelloidae]OZM57593.1 hypothetical protein CIB95_04275 [Lottiidibacillus patelloidae]